MYVAGESGGIGLSSSTARVAYRGVPLPLLAGFARVEANGNVMVALRPDGRAVAWHSTYAELVDTSRTFIELTPTSSYGCGLTAEHKVYCWDPDTRLPREQNEGVGPPAIVCSVSERRGLLVLHGITMSGASVLRTLGPLGERLEAVGFELVAPNAAHRLSGAELGSLSDWMAKRYRDVGQSYTDDFSDGRFWDSGEHYDWFQADTDQATGKKRYLAVERSLENVAAAIRDRPVAGVLGFSQGAAMAMIVAARGCQGDPRFSSVRFGIFLSGFKPVFDEPKLLTYPAGPLPRLLAIGERDPIFPGNAGHLASVSQAFDGGEEELIVVPGLGHEVATEASVLERIANFARRAAA